MKKLFSAQRVAVASVLVAYLVLAIGYSVVNPLYESTDEIRHYHYVRHLLAYRALPVQDPSLPLAQSHHPPLYYALAALASAWVQPNHPLYFSLPTNVHWGYRYWEVSVDNKNQYMHGADEAFPYQGDALAAHLDRWVNVLIGLCTVWLAYRLGRVVFPNQPALALGGMAFVAFNPMFLYLSGAINNDIIAALTGSAVLLACAEIIARGLSLRRVLILGALYGLALMSKFNLAFIVGLIELALLADAWRRRTARDLAWANLAVLGMALLVAGWWFIRNQALYGEPTGFQRVTELWGARDPRTSLPLALSELPYAWTSLWGRFGYGQLPLPDWIYTSLQIVSGLALVGLGLRCAQLWRARSSSLLVGLQLGLLVASVLSFAGVLFGYMLVSPAGPMGRFFFPALSALGLCMFYGLSALAPARWVRGLALACLATMAGLSLYALMGVLAPASLPPPPLSAAQQQAIAHPIGVTLGGKARLLGYDLDRNHAAPGERVYLTLYWQAVAPFDRNYILFVHLLSDAGPLVTQRDTHPALGRYPTQAWQVGYAFADRIPLDIPSTAYTPDQARVYVGLYNPETGERLVVPGERDNVLPLAPFQVERAPGEYPLALNFNSEITLVDYTLSARSLSAGQALTLTLYWRPTQPVAYDYNIFTHVLGQENHTWAVNDGTPNTTPHQTSHWVATQVYQDVRVLRLAPDTPPGLYPIEMGWFGGLKGDRLPIVAANGHYLDDRIMLTQIRVTAP